MKRACISLAVMIASLVMVVGCNGPDAKVGKAVYASLAPETEASSWSPVLKGPGPTQEEVRKLLGSHNLTAFLLTLSAKDSDALAKGYAWDFAAPNPAGIARYLSDNSTLVASKHISNLLWVKGADGKLTGSFVVKTPYGLNATLLFAASEKGGSTVVTKLAVAKKGSAALADGFIVFERN